jgi:hypothetical protein
MQVADGGGRSRRCFMKRMRMGLPGLAAGAVLAGFFMVQDAEAGLRFRAAINTPNLVVHAGNIPSCYHGYHRRGNLPVRAYYYRINKHDRRIARRLARYTGVPARELMRLRRMGYHWFEIGRHLGLPRPVVRCAMNKRSWKHFLRYQARRTWPAAGCGHQRVVYIGD